LIRVTIDIPLDLNGVVVFAILCLFASGNCDLDLLVGYLRDE
jgi:hypothetical protein